MCTYTSQKSIALDNSSQPVTDDPATAEPATAEPAFFDF